MTVVELTQEEAKLLRALLETAARGANKALWASVVRPLTRLLVVLP